MKVFTLLASIILPLCMVAQPPMGHRQKVRGERKFDIIVTNAKDSAIVTHNRNLDLAKKRSLNMTRSFGADLLNATSITGVNQVVGISTNLIGLGFNSLSKALKGDREKWYKAVTDQCRFVRTLKTGTEINDFYAAGSEKGAMDPENMKFEGFGCHNYIELIDEPDRGNEAFYVFCSLRRDSLGLAHITDHSKFMVEIDTLMFAPDFCNLPNDSTGRLDMKFDFNGRKDLVFNIKARIYSSWINEAIMVNHDQLLGEFNITARIDPNALEDGKFIYSKNDKKNADLVSVTGDCFIVPRSFTGTTDAQNYSPAWGTGQYSIELEVRESCRIDDSYYQNGKDGKKKWDKSKWQPEWEQIKVSQRKDPNLFNQAIQTITVGYTNNGWVGIISEPITTTLIKSETTELNKLLNLNQQTSTAAKAATNSAKSANTSASAIPSAPAGGGTPPATQR